MNMPKMKSHSGSRKRFRKNAAGKLKRAAAYRRHHAWARSSSQTMGLRGVRYVSKMDEQKINILLPY
ncbi:50S ribosomal protein L35 [Candidatus Dependentiae bacterium]